MSKKTITRDLILRGISTSDHFGQEGQFQASIGIEPDFPLDDSVKKPSGLIRPTSMAKFSGTEITGAPLWMINNPKETNLYIYTYDGKVHVVTSALAMGTALNSGNAMTNASGNGGEYYDNKIILVKETDVAAYTLWGTPNLDQTYWTTTLSLTALTNTTYPSINGVEMPNHVAFRHTDNACYIADVVGNIGVLHKLKTKKTTNEGDTNDGSAYNVIDFNYGWYPTAITNWNNYLLVGLIEGTNTTIYQKPAKLILWDTISSSFEDVTPDNFVDPLITAIKNINGNVYIFGGSAGGGCRVTRFIGVNIMEQLAYIPDAYPPFAGAVDHFLSKIVWGSKTTIPAAAGVVYSLGSLYPEFNPTTGLHCPFFASGTGANPIVTAVKYFAQGQEKPYPLIGWKTD